MTMLSTSYHEFHLEQLRQPEFAQAFLQVALEEYSENRNVESLLNSLRDIAKAQGGMAKLAERTSLNRQSLYKALSPQGNPRLETFSAILHGLGYRMRFEQLPNHS